MIVAAAGMAALAVGVALRSHATPPRALEAQRRPPLLLLTSLPIMFNEDFTLGGTGSPVLRKLRSSYEVLPISVTDAGDLKKGRLLLMAQPFAQTPENLVLLDRWVRDGGHVLLLADPLLEWPSKRPLGDLTRPPPMYADTGLLAHWGLKLEAPEERGIVVQQLGKHRVATVSPGRLTGSCNMRDQGFDARCRIGKGEVTVIADADFVNTEPLGADGKQNLDALMDELASLERP